MKHNKYFITIFFGLIFSIVFFTSSNAQLTYPSSLYMTTQNTVNSTGDFLKENGYTSIGGDLMIYYGSDITDLTPLNGLTSVGGKIYIYDNTALINLNGLESITSVGGDLWIESNTALTNIDSLAGITSVGGRIWINENTTLTNLDGLKGLTSSFSGEVYVAYNAALQNLAGLENLTSIGGNLTIYSNATLTNLDGLEGITSIGGSLTINNNPALTDIDPLKNLTSIGEALLIQLNAALTNLDGLRSLTFVGWSLAISYNTALVKFCGLYPLFSSGTVGVAIQIFDNGANPTVAEIIAAGPCPPSVTAVAVDIKPETCPNSFNVKKKGTISVAILGTDDFDVQNIDPASLKLEGISPLRWSIEDVATPVSEGGECACTTDGPDGFNDLNVIFDAQELVAALGQVNDGDELVLTITGNLTDDTPIEGSDCVVILAKNLKKDLAGNLNNVPEEYALLGNYPNPFNPSTIIRYELPKQSYVNLRLYDVLGREVAVLVNEQKPAGRYEIKFDAKNLPSGIYLFRIEAGDFVKTRKMLLLK